MDNKQLAQYRVDIVRDSIDPNTKPDRVPHISHFVTWKILDAGYKLTEAMTNWDIMEKCVCRFQEIYRYDGLVEFGHRNNYATSLALGSSRYDVNDEEGAVNYADFALLDTDELVEYVTNPMKFNFEKGMARKYPFWNDPNGFDIDILNKAYVENQKYFAFMGLDFRGTMPTKLYNDYGVPWYMHSKGGAPIPIESLQSSLRGLKGLSIDMRRHLDVVRETVAILKANVFDKGIAAMKTKPAGSERDSTFDNDMILLAYNTFNPKQWDEFYWPYLQEIFGVLSEKEWTTRFFTEGVSGRFWDYFNDLPRGVCAYHMENDDIFEAQKALPGMCLMGGMKNETLGTGTKQKCLDLAKRLIDEVGSEGRLIISEDKLGSYRNDANPENLKAVCDFVLEYRPSQN